MTKWSRDAHSGVAIPIADRTQLDFDDELVMCPRCGKWVEADDFDPVDELCLICWEWPQPPPRSLPPTGACTLCGAPVGRDGALCPSCGERVNEQHREAR